MPVEAQNQSFCCHMRTHTHVTMCWLRILSRTSVLTLAVFVFVEDYTHLVETTECMHALFTQCSTIWEVPLSRTLTLVLTPFVSFCTWPQQDSASWARTSAKALQVLILSRENRKANPVVLERNYTSYPKPLVRPGLTLTGPALLEGVPELELARQLTLMDFNQFKAIEPRECLNQVCLPLLLLSWNSLVSHSCFAFSKTCLWFSTYMWWAWVHKSID